MERGIYRAASPRPVELRDLEPEDELEIARASMDAKPRLTWHAGILPVGLLLPFIAMAIFTSAGFVVMGFYPLAFVVVLVPLLIVDQIRARRRLQRLRSEGYDVAGALRRFGHSERTCAQFEREDDAAPRARIAPVASPAVGGDDVDATDAAAQRRHG